MLSEVMTWQVPGFGGLVKQLSWLKRPHNKVHSVPDIVWRRSSSSSSEHSDDDNKAESADLIDAAMLLLKDATLAGATKPSLQQQQQQTVGALAAKDWDAFVEKCTAVKRSTVASSRLLAMRNAVPSPSARMVFQSQVGSSPCQPWC